MPSSSLVRPDGARIAYRTSHAGEPTVVLVHGWMTSGRVWDPLLAEIPEVPTLTVDLRGAGASSAGDAPLSLDLFAEDVLAVADHAGLGSFHLVGHSMGGQIAQLVAALQPARVSSLLLLNPVPLQGLPLPEPMASGFRTAGGQRAALDGILSAACRELSDAARAVLLGEAMKIAPEVIAAGFDAWTRGAPSVRRESIRARTLIVGTSDPFLPVELLTAAIVSRIPGARLRELPGPGHYPQVERPAETAALLAAFWSHR